MQDKKDLFAKETTAAAPESTWKAELISGEDKPDPSQPKQFNEGWGNYLNEVTGITITHTSSSFKLENEKW